MRNLTHLNEYRIKYRGCMGNEKNGAFVFRLSGSNLNFVAIASDGAGWDHVSVSTESRCPRWNGMQQVKDLFFEPEEVAMQLHPAKSEYVNNFPYCLHILRPQNTKIPTPPSILVGIKEAGCFG